MLYYTIPYSTLLYSTLLYCTVLYYTIPYSTLLYSTILYYTTVSFFPWFGVLASTRQETQLLGPRPHEAALALEHLERVHLILKAWGASISRAADYGRL